jgi:uncharacterized protein (TIGR04255 family)
MPEPVYPRLSRAPIAEAAIEIRATLSLPVPEGVYDKFREAVAERYPTHNAMRFLVPHFHIESESEVRTETASSLVGVRLESSDKRTIVQAKSDGLVVSRLSPYESWETLIAEVRSLWAVYFEVFAPSAVMRLGVRYINRIDLDYIDGRIDFDTVFTAAPQIPRGLPQTLESFATRILMPIATHEATLAIVQALEAPTIDGAHFAVLDLDAFTNTLMKPDTDDMWNQLERLREIKNMAFFESLLRPIWEKYL